MLREYDHEFAEFLYYTPTEFDKESPFWLVRTGSNVAKPNYRVGPRRIECYSIHFVREGSLVLECEGKHNILQAGDAFCMYPNRSYVYYKHDEKDVLRLSWLAMDGPGMEKLLMMAGFRAEQPYLSGRWNASLEERLEEITSLLRQDREERAGSSFELKGLLYRLFSLLLQASEPVDPLPDAKQGWVDKCMEYMRLHAAEGITVRQVAEFAGLNRTYFTTLFTKSAGITPAAYIAKVKMNKAKEMLITTSASITEIAYSLGYPTLFAFTRAFTNYYSIAPSAYRNQNNSR